MAPPPCPRCAGAAGYIESLLHEVKLAKTYRTQKGGQTVGPPHLAGAPLSTLLQLERELGWALKLLKGEMEPP